MAPKCAMCHVGGKTKRPFVSRADLPVLSRVCPSGSWSSAVAAGQAAPTPCPPPRHHGPERGHRGAHACPEGPASGPQPCSGSSYARGPRSQATAHRGLQGSRRPQALPLRTVQQWRAEVWTAVGASSAGGEGSSSPHTLSTGHLSRWPGTAASSLAQLSFLCCRSLI